MPACIQDLDRTAFSQFLANGMMRRRLLISLCSAAALVHASRDVFNVHDDLLAYPQFEIAISPDFIAKADADVLLDTVGKPPAPRDVHRSSVSSPDHGASASTPNATHELMYLDSHAHLCTIPRFTGEAVANASAQAEARLATRHEIARASARGWELLAALEGNCLYFISGWWSYQFCYNGEVTQFHQLGPQAGRAPYPPQRDPTTPEFTLGKVRAAPHKGDNVEDEWGNRIEPSSRDGSATQHGRTDLQEKGSQRYLVQTMDGGSICDLTGRPRQVEVQYHCMPQISDRIGYIKEVTTCSYLMIIYTSRLCSDVAFLPPKEEEAHQIVCRRVMTDDDDATRKDIGGPAASSQSAASSGIVIGGILVGGGKYLVGGHGGVNSGAGGGNSPEDHDPTLLHQRMPVPAHFGPDDLTNPGVETIAVGKSRAEGGQVVMMNDADLARLDIDPRVVAELRREVQEMARERGWKIEVVENPGELREILGIVDDDDDEGEEGVDNLLEEMAETEQLDEMEADDGRGDHGGEPDGKSTGKDAHRSDEARGDDPANADEQHAPPDAPDAAEGGSEEVFFKDEL